MNSKPRVPIARPDLGPAEQENVRRAMEAGWITQGPFVAEAEKRLQDLTGRKHAIMTSSGTTALIVALMAIDRGLRPWVVSAPVLTFAAVHNAIRLLRGTVQLQGADEWSWQVPYRDLTLRADATVAAPCYGKLEGMNHVWGGTVKGPVIEDACESFCATLNGLPAGVFGTISVLSFYANKICTAGEGGALLVDDKALALRLRAIVNHGMVNKSYVPAVSGLNGRMTDLQAAVLCAQLERLPEMLERRRHIESAYESVARGRWQLRTTADGEVCAPWLFAAIPEDVSEVWRRCENENVEWRPFFPIPFNLYDQRFDELIENAMRLSAGGIVLPLSSALTDEEVERVIDVIRGK